jgi:hypothetical protein
VATGRTPALGPGSSPAGGFCAGISGRAKRFRYAFANVAIASVPSMLSVSAAGRRNCTPAPVKATKTSPRLLGALTQRANTLLIRLVGASAARPPSAAVICVWWSLVVIDVSSPT